MPSKLVPCHVCKEMIAESAARCPKCGVARNGGDGKQVAVNHSTGGCVFVFAWIIPSAYAISRLFFT
jgi:hypothetical protein